MQQPTTNRSLSESAWSRAKADSQWLKHSWLFWIWEALLSPTIGTIVGVKIPDWWPSVPVGDAAWVWTDTWQIVAGALATAILMSLPIGAALGFNVLRSPYRQRNEARAKLETTTQGLAIEIDSVEQSPAYEGPREDGSQIWKLQVLVINRYDEPEGIVRAWAEIDEPEGTRILDLMPFEGKPIGIPVRLEPKETKRVEIVFFMGPRTGNEKSLSLVAVDHSGRRIERQITSNGIPEKLIWVGTLYV